MCVQSPSTDADAVMTSFRSGYSSGSATGYITINKATSSGCTYVQAKPVAAGAVDGSWKRQTGNRCAAGSATYAWSDSFFLGYGGFKVRICRDVLGPDSCGAASATITR